VRRISLSSGAAYQGAVSVKWGSAFGAVPPAVRTRSSRSACWKNISGPPFAMVPRGNLVPLSEIPALRSEVEAALVPATREQTIKVVVSLFASFEIPSNMVRDPKGL
jgi:hypothetical protein